VLTAVPDSMFYFRSYQALHSSSSTVSTSMFSHGLMVCTSFGDLVLELVVVLGLEVLSVGSKDELVTRLNLGLLGGLPHQHVLGVLGAGKGSGASVLLFQVKLLVLSSLRVHLHNNPLGLGADALEAEGDCARVGECRRQRNASGC
jgi:hypothetical protein